MRAAKRLEIRVHFFVRVEDEERANFPFNPSPQFDEAFEAQQLTDAHPV